MSILITQNLHFNKVLLVFLLLNISGKSVLQPTHNHLPFSNIDQLPLALSVYQDNDGFIWLGTYEGLIRYDGQSSKYYKHQPNDTFSIAGNVVNSIIPDNQNNLWLAVFGEGLEYFDVKTQQITHYQDVLEKAGITDKVISLMLDSENKLWIGTQSPVVSYYDMEIDEVRVIEDFISNQSDQNLPMPIRDIEEDSNGNIWMTQYSQLTKYDRVGDSLLIITPPFKIPYLNQIEIDHSSDQIFIGDAVNGIFLIDPESLEWTSLESAYPEFSHIKIMSLDHLTLSDEGHLWIHDYNGIHNYDLLRKKYNHFPMQNQMGQFFIEKQGNVFFFGQETYRMKAPNPEFHSLLPQSMEEDWFNGYIIYRDRYAVNAFLGEGFIIFDLNTGNRVNVKELFTELKALSPKIVFEDSKGNWWIADFSPEKNNNPHQLYKYNPNSGDLKPIEGRRWSTIGSIVEDKDGLIWAGSWGGLVKIHPEKGIVDYYLEDNDDPNSLSSNSIRKLFIDSHENLWIATSSGGLNLFNLTSETFRHWKYDRVDTNSLSNDYVWDIYEDSKERIWVATENGLNLYNAHDETFTRYLVGKGEQYHMVYSIEEDDAGYLWLSNMNVIMRFDPSSNELLAFNEMGGIYSHKDSNGNIYFGNSFFHPDSIQFRNSTPSLNFTGFTINNEDVPINEHSVLTSQINSTKVINLDHTHTNFSISFAGWYFQDPKALKYQYLLEGFNDYWQLTNQPSLSYTHLPPGSYTLRIKAGNEFIGWGKERTLMINILPPWYRSIWAYIIYTAGGIFILMLFYRWKKHEWEMKTKLVLEHEETERLKKLDEFKTRFFTNISHEFRTPLTVIMGMAEHIRNQPENWFIKGSDMIQRNASILMRLVNNLLSLSKLEVGMVPISMVQGDIIVYLRYIQESFHSLAELKHITLEFISKRKSFYMDYDPEKLREICTNILSNAIKHTPSNGKISMTIKFKPDPGQNMLQISITDTGSGIAKNDIPYIFNRYYRASHNDEGQGIGLALTLELVKLLKGEISVQSEEGVGSKFTVNLPVTNMAPIKNINKPILQDQEYLQYAIKQDINDQFHKVTMLDSLSEKEKPLVLIVEDHDDVVQYLTACLSEKYRLAIAKNGKEGLDSAVKNIPDIIVSDVMMPVMDGLEMVKKLKSDFRTSHIPLILLTAKADIESRLSGLEMGADVYLAKPFHKTELEVRLRKLIELRRMLHERYKQFQFSTSADPKLKAEDIFINKVNRLLISQISNEKYGIPELCRDMSMSRTQLYRKFTALTGQSIGHYFKSLRISKAKELLLNSDKNVSEIAFEVGFNDAAYFSKAFKDNTGSSPSQFRAPYS